MRWLVLLSLGLVSGCRDAAYSAASKRDTIAAWREFLAQNPSDSNVDSARERLAELEFDEAQHAHTILAYKRFLEEFQDSAKAPQAKALLETLRFAAATARGTSFAMRQFMAEHPEGAHRAEAEALLQQLELRELATGSDPQVLAPLVARHPDAREAEAAGERLDEVAWSRAQSAASLSAYLRDFPAGKHRDEARARLTELEIESALLSGDLGHARELAAKTPLASLLPQLKARLQRADQEASVLKSRDELVQRALPGWSLRPVEELVRALKSPDPMDRWLAAEELGHAGSPAAIGPLLEALRSARLSAVRQRAFDALELLFKTLPRPVADYEIATRLEALAHVASDSELALSMAALFDLSGQLERASAEYQRAFDPTNPDPIVLRRWAAIRLERRQFFSAAVVARQLAHHAEVASADSATPQASNALTAARELCSAVEEVRAAVATLEVVAREKTEFPDDVTAFLVRAREQARLVEARLHDAELNLRTERADARLCGDDPVMDRLNEGVARRLEALQALRSKKAPEFAVIRTVVRDHDWSMLVRAEVEKP